MSEIKIHCQGSANQYAILLGSDLLGEVLGNGDFLEEQHLQFANFAVNLLSGCFPIAPANAQWKTLSADEPNRLTLISSTNNQPTWLIILITPEALPAISYEVRVPEILCAKRTAKP